MDWEHRADYIRQRSHRKRQPGEFDVEPEWATEAVLLDPPGRLVRDSGSESGESIEVIGYSVSADRILTVLLVPKDHPPSGDWWGASAWAASDADQRDYVQEQRRHGNQTKHS